MGYYGETWEGWMEGIAYCTELNQSSLFLLDFCGRRGLYVTNITLKH